MKQLLLLFLLLPALLPAQQVATKIGGYNAYVYTPKGYSTANKYPLLIAIPGNKEIGTNIALLNAYLPCQFIAAGALAPNEIVICIQPLSQWPSVSWLKQIYDSVIRRWSVDLTRVSLTGYSAGGTVCDGFAINYSSLVAGVFSLSAPAMQSGPVDAPLYASFAAEGGHLWALDGSLDNSNQIALAVSTMNTASPSSAIYTEIAGLTHCCWNMYYNPSYTLNGFNCYNWLLQWTQPRAIAPPPLGNKRIVLQTPDPRYRQVYYPSVAGAVNPQPGDTLVIPTGIHSFYLQNFAGTPAKPIIIIPADSGWIGGYTDYAGSIGNATYFKIMGFHIDCKDSSNLGLYIGQQTGFYEACNMEIKNSASEGFVAKANPDTLSPLNQYPNWTIQNVSIHDIYVHHCVNENFYIGYTNDVIKPLAPLFNNLTLYNLHSDSSFYMGLVLSDATNVHLYNILVTHFGISNQSSYQNGIAVGYVTLADSSYNVTVSGGTGAGLLLFGKGVWKLRNWNLSNCATSAGQSAIYVDDRADIGYNFPPLQLDFNAINVAEANKYALDVVNTNNTMLPGMIADFNYSGTALGIFDQVDKIVITAPITKAIAFSITLMDGKKLTVYFDGSYTFQ